VIQLPTGTKIWIAAGVTDMRRGFDGLSALRVEENERLKRIVADLTLDRQILQEIVSKKL
jgi:hypothetical protein